MQKRVHQFNALVPVLDDAVATVPACAETFCRWLVGAAGNFASHGVEGPLAIRRLQGRAPPSLPEEEAEAASENIIVEFF